MSNPNLDASPNVVEAERHRDNRTAMVVAGIVAVVLIAAGLIYFIYVNPSAGPSASDQANIAQANAAAQQSALAAQQANAQAALANTQAQTSGAVAQANAAAAQAANSADVAGLRADRAQSQPQAPQTGEADSNAAPAPAN